MSWSRTLMSECGYLRRRLSHIVCVPPLAWLDHLVRHVLLQGAGEEHDVAAVQPEEGAPHGPAGRTFSRRGSASPPSGRSWAGWP